jgi:hypothetical protein
MHSVKEVVEMDVNLINSLATPSYKPVIGVGEGSTGAVSGVSYAVESEMKQIASQKTSEKTMMDLRDVQRFLYMLIGSEIKVESESKFPGQVLNSRA